MLSDTCHLDFMGIGRRGTHPNMKENQSPEERRNTELVIPPPFHSRIQIQTFKFKIISSKHKYTAALQQQAHTTQLSQDRAATMLQGL